ncbi:hypothetical protein [Microbulbifer elongatus]|uniref:hypothetical protein n=1 Tax=Microbulbifer elongatus TaxID=86173 RepID=UPI001CFEFF0A|nr:hypothetical protein [Microbulbifer elongatus]
MAKIKMDLGACIALLLLLPGFAYAKQIEIVKTGEIIQTFREVETTVCGPLSVKIETEKFPATADNHLYIEKTGLKFIPGFNGPPTYFHVSAKIDPMGRSATTIGELLDSKNERSSSLGFIPLKALCTPEGLVLQYWLGGRGENNHRIFRINSNKAENLVVTPVSWAEIKDHYK